MTLKSFLQGHWFQRIVLLVWLVSSALVMFSQRSIDAIVHGTLYSYGLQFSTIWAQPYWTYARILYASQFVSIGLSLVALGFGFLKKDNGDKQAPKLEQNANKQAPKCEQNADASVSRPEKITGDSIVISCPACKRAFSKPLVMLDFSGGKAKLVNVCPYCNGVLGKAEEQDDTGMIADHDKKLVH
jgi:uncharacterized Zn-finger protein